MKSVRIKDKQFVSYLKRAVIRRRIRELAGTLRRELAGSDPLFICILNGAFIFAADLLRAFDRPAEIAFVRACSYVGTGSSGKLTQVLGLTDPVTRRDVVLVEDVIDSGLTVYELKKQLEAAGAASVRVVTLTLKPDALRYPLVVDHAAFEIPNDFIIGYGMDYDGFGRNLSDVYVVVNPET